MNGKAYLAIVRIRFINGLQYRSAALAGLVTQFAWGFMLILMFMAFYRSNPDAFPMTLPATVSYVWLQQSLLALFSVYMWNNDILESISSGGIVYELARPLGLYGKWFAECIALRLSRVVLRSVPILLLAIVLPDPWGIAPPAGMLAFVFFLLSIVLAAFVVIAFGMLVYIGSMYTLSSVGLRIITMVLVDFLAGNLVPIPFFPEPWRTVAEFLPFASMGNAPLRIYSGDIAGAALAETILLQVFWAVVLLCIGLFCMRRAVRKIIVQGG
jgi:ABC-2 type transport system permease protein